MRYSSYKFATDFLSPLITAWLLIRRARGKGDKQRFRERFGYASVPRPAGTLLWLHAASVGEANSVLQLIDQIRARQLPAHLLLTTGTVSSAKLMHARLPGGVIHQFAPIDTPDATLRFLRHWKPDIGFWVESEFWPNLVMNARKRGCFMVVVNGRMSQSSYQGWQRYALHMMFDMMRCFDVIFAQSEIDGERLRALGAPDVRYVGNLKYDADMLPCDEAALLFLQQTIGGRPVWLAASTHPGEEEIIAQAHGTLAATHPNLLTVIAPRHAQRGAEIAQKLPGQVALRSRGDAITPATAFYIADTMGELGLFYRLCEIVFMGGSLVPHGGQNPLEPLKLRCAIITGPHTHNFAQITADMDKAGILARAQNAGQLARHIDRFLKNPDTIAETHIRAKEWLKDKTGATLRIIDMLAPIFVPVPE